MKKNYIVDSESKKVVAEYETAPDTVVEECGYNPIILQACIRELNNDADSLINYKSLKNYYGVSQCYEDDEFNEMIGSDIAGVKLDLKYHKRMVKDWDKIIKHLNKALKVAEAHKERHSGKVQNIINDLIRVYGFDPNKF